MMMRSYAVLIFVLLGAPVHVAGRRTKASKGKLAKEDSDMAASEAFSEVATVRNLEEWQALAKESAGQFASAMKRVCLNPPIINGDTKRSVALCYLFTNSYVGEAEKFMNDNGSDYSDFFESTPVTSSTSLLESAAMVKNLEEPSSAAEASSEAAKVHGTSGKPTMNASYSSVAQESIEAKKEELQPTPEEVKQMIMEKAQAAAASGFKCGAVVDSTEACYPKESGLVSKTPACTSNCILKDKMWGAYQGCACSDEDGSCTSWNSDWLPGSIKTMLATYSIKAEKATGKWQYLKEGVWTDPAEGSGTSFVQMGNIVEPSQSELNTRLGGKRFGGDVFGTKAEGYYFDYCDPIVAYHYSRLIQ